MAVNCWLVPRAIEDSAAELTFSVVEPVTDPSVAVTAVCPVLALLASPLLPLALLMVATPAILELQLTVVVMFCVLPSV